MLKRSQVYLPSLENYLTRTSSCTYFIRNAGSIVVSRLAAEYDGPEEINRGRLRESMYQQVTKGPVNRSRTTAGTGAKTVRPVDLVQSGDAARGWIDYTTRRPRRKRVRGT